jgi:hypothetical protein
MAVCLMNLIMALVLLSELKDEVATNDKTISSYDEWFNAKYGNWFDDVTDKIIFYVIFLSAHMPYFKRIEPI